MLSIVGNMNVIYTTFRELAVLLSSGGWLPLYWQILVVFLFLRLMATIEVELKTVWLPDIH
jgi:hypothetical protein